MAVSKLVRFSLDDAAYMRRALALARRGLGRVEPNPMVGAVVVQERIGSGVGRVVGEGFHRRYGGAHAEVEALKVAGKRARGATLYVTLEPCCHWGKTPPCVDAILAAGVKRVVTAMIDPFAQVRGRGVRKLRQAGVRVDVGLLEAEARALNAAFITRVGEGRPFVIAKWAQSLDGCIATASGESKWISSEESRARVQVLRGRVDGIIVGINTALADDPLLTARVEREADLRRLATRIVVDSDCRLPVNGQLVRTVCDAPVLVAHRAELGAAGERRRKVLEARGVMTLALPAERDGRVSLKHLMKHLGKMEYTNVLVEGGAELMGAFFRAGLVDEALVVIAPIVIGGNGAKHAVGGSDLRKLAEARRMTVVETRMVGGDVHLVLR